MMMQNPKEKSKNSVRLKPLKRTKSRAQQPVKNEQQQSNRVVSLQSVQKSSKVILIEPRVYAEAQDISEHLKNKRAVVVNLQRIERDQGVRIIDFLAVQYMH